MPLPGLHEIAPEKLRGLADTELLQMHRRLHQWAGLQDAGKATFNREDLVNAHRFVEEEFKRRLFNHSIVAPLDREAEKLERGAEAAVQSPQDAPAAPAAPVVEAAPANSPNPAMEPPVLAILAKMPREIVIQPDFASLSGSLLFDREGHEPRDADFIIRAPEVDNIVAMKLARAFAAAGGQQEPSFVPAPAGAAWDHCSIYDLVLKRRDKLEVTPVDTPEYRALVYAFDNKAAELKEQRAPEEIKPGTPFDFPKAGSAYREGEVTRVDELWDTWASGIIDSGAQIAVEKKFDGVNLQIHRKGGKVMIWTEDARAGDRAEFLPTIARDAKAMPGGDFIAFGEAIIYQNDKPLPRFSFVPKIAVGKQPLGGIDLRVHVHSLAYLEKDLRGLERREVRAMLDRWLPSDRGALRRVPYRLASSRKSLEEAIAWASGQPGSEGAMLKSWSGPTSKFFEHAGQAKFKLIAEIAVVVIGRRRKPGPITVSGAKVPAHPLVGDAAKKLHDELGKEQTTWIYRCAFRRGDKLQAFDAERTLTRIDLALRWVVEGQPDPITQRPVLESGWRGTDDPDVWEMLSGHPQRDLGDLAYGNTFGFADEEGLVKPGTVITVQPELIRQFVWSGTERLSWSHPVVRNVETAPGRQADDIATIKRITDVERADVTKQELERAGIGSKPEEAVDAEAKESASLEWDACNESVAWCPDEDRLAGDLIGCVGPHGEAAAELREEEITATEAVKVVGDESNETRDEARAKLQREIGDWYMIRHPGPGRRLDFVMQYHHRGIMTSQALEASVKALRTAATRADKKLFESLWRRDGWRWVDGTFARLSAVVQGADDRRGDVSKALDLQLAASPGSLADFLRHYQRRAVQVGNVHLDFRMKRPAGDALVGWTSASVKIVLQRPNGALFYPLRDRMLDGRPIGEGRSGEAPDNVFAAAKPLQPLAWLKLVSPKRPRYEAEPGSVGATAFTAGIFTFEAGGHVIYGSSKSDYHELFLTFTKGKRRPSGRWGVQLIEPQRELQKVPLDRFWIVNRPSDRRPYVMSHRLETEKKKAQDDKIEMLWAGQNAMSALSAADYFRGDLSAEHREWLTKATAEERRDVGVSYLPPGQPTSPDVKDLEGNSEDDRPEPPDLPVTGEGATAQAAGAPEKVAEPPVKPESEPAMDPAGQPAASA